MTNDLSLKVSQHVPASPERVFDAWLDPKMISRFMITGPTAGVKSAETDPRIGGRYAIAPGGRLGSDRSLRLVMEFYFLPMAQIC
jgi:uncharacterized protein YndB with AHSA1/START domain